MRSVCEMKKKETHISCKFYDDSDDDDDDDDGDDNEMIRMSMIEI